MKESVFRKKQLIFVLLAIVSFLALLFFCIRLGRGGVPLLFCLIVHTCSLLLLYRDALIGLEPEEWEDTDDWMQADLPEETEEEPAIGGVPLKHIYAEVRESLIDETANPPVSKETADVASADAEEPPVPDAFPPAPEEPPAAEEAPPADAIHAFLSAKQNIVEMDLIAAARDAMESLSSFAEAQKIKLHLSTTCDSLLMKADPESIRILFRNIIDNSIKYMGRPGHMIITISLLGDDIFLILKDTGNGLSEDETLHVFELNFQGSNRVSGNGLGLTQTKMIVEAFGGTIYAKSSPGNGMAIYIQLPVSGSPKNP
ncbi:MAG: sensor histidine kinase [Anaerotignum sp.]